MIHTESLNTEDPDDDVFLPDAVDDLTDDINDVTADRGQLPVTQQCGACSWRPRCIQPLASLPSFTACMSCLGLIGSVNFSYYTAVISQVEREYGMSSSVSGLIKNIDNVGFLLTVLAFSHFCRHGNKPRLFAITNIVASVAIFSFSLPHFIFPPSNVLHHSLPTDDHNVTATGERYDVCDAVPRRQSAGECTKRSVHIGALVILATSGLLQGAARSPQATLSLTYMDDTARDSSPKYFGFMFGSRALAPVFGFLLGAWTTSIYVDLSDPGIAQGDPRWVGAWWIGFIICGGATIVWSLPLALYPAKLPVNTSRSVCRHRRRPLDGGVCDQNANSKNEQSGDMIVAKPSRRSRRKSSGFEAVQDPDDFMTNLRDMPRALCRLLQTPVFLLVILGACCNMSLLGFITFLAKYIETQFVQSTSISNIYTGCISAFAWAAGPVVSGRVLSRFRVSARRSLLLIVCIQIASLIGFVAMLLLGCKETPWAGSELDAFRSDRLNVTDWCNVECGCESGFVPVCGEDGHNYYSPCYAGCVAYDNVTNTFSGCDCVPSGVASVGRCPLDCYAFIPYLVTLGVTSFVASMTVVPMMTVLLRCVEDRDKSLSIALGTAFVNFAAFPAPIIYGMVVDSTCLVKQASCHDDGACLFYDPTQLRLKLHGVEIGIKAIALIFFVIAFLVARRQKFSDELSDAASVEGEQTL